MTGTQLGPETGGRSRHRVHGRVLLACWAVLCGLLSLLSHTLQDHVPRVDTTHSVLGLQHQSLRKCPTGLPTDQPGGTIFSKFSLCKWLVMSHWHQTSWHSAHVFLAWSSRWCTLPTPPGSDLTERLLSAAIILVHQPWMTHYSGDKMVTPISTPSQGHQDYKQDQCSSSRVCVVQDK